MKCNYYVTLLVITVGWRAKISVRGRIIHADQTQSCTIKITSTKGDMTICNIILHHQTFVFPYFDGKELFSIGVDDELP